MPRKYFNEVAQQLFGCRPASICFLGGQLLAIQMHCFCLFIYSCGGQKCLCVGSVLGLETLKVLLHTGQAETDTGCTRSLFLSFQGQGSQAG